MAASSRLPGPIHRRCRGCPTAVLAGRHSARLVDAVFSGLEGELVSGALAALEPEPARARALAGRRGGGSKALRWLAARGFEASTLEELAGFAEEA